MSDPIILNIEVQDPIEIELNSTSSVELDIQIENPIELQAVQSGLAIGPPGPAADSNFWEDDMETTIKPVGAKTVDADNISGTIYGGLFQP